MSTRNLTSLRYEIPPLRPETTATSTHLSFRSAVNLWPVFSTLWWWMLQQHHTQLPLFAIFLVQLELMVEDAVKLEFSFTIFLFFIFLLILFKLILIVFLCSLIFYGGTEGSCAYNFGMALAMGRWCENESEILGKNYIKQEVLQWTWKVSYQTPLIRTVFLRVTTNETKEIMTTGTNW